MIIKSILDNDLYKVTMCASMLRRYPNNAANFKFRDRSGTIFPDGFEDRLMDEIKDMASLRLTVEEYNWLLKNCEFLTTEFMSYISTFHYRPAQACIGMSADKHLSMSFNGLYPSVMPWEVPMMATVSELYFDMMGIKPDERAIDRMIEKANFIYKHGLFVSDFGTRRRFSFDIQDQLVGIMKDIAGHFFIGTSNMYLAMKHGVSPIGTQAHEWYMANGCMCGVENANSVSLREWECDYNGKFLIALTDTYTSDVFFRDMTPQQARLWQGLRQDSGDPLLFLEKAIGFYKSMGINPKSKKIVFSDSLDLSKALEIRDYAADRIQCVFGIGTNLTNDVGANPLNIVIKLDGMRDDELKLVRAVKLSDSPGKHTGDPAAVAEAKSKLKIQ